MPAPIRPPIDRFGEKYKVDGNGCWVWTASLNPGGYGQFNDGQRLTLAHRFSYETHIGPIPEGLVLDHLCRNRQCVRPDHLEPCTLGENTLRSPVAPPAINARKEYCIWGHPLSGTNLVRYDRHRVCRVCRTEASKRYQAGEKARLREIRPLARDEYEGEVFTVQVKIEALRMLVRELNPEDKSKYLWDFTNFPRPVMSDGDVIEVLDLNGSIHEVDCEDDGDLVLFTCRAHGHCFATYHAAKAVKAEVERKYGSTLRAIR